MTEPRQGTRTPRTPLEADTSRCEARHGAPAPSGASQGTPAPRGVRAWLDAGAVPEHPDHAPALWARRGGLWRPGPWPSALRWSAHADGSGALLCAFSPWDRWTTQARCETPPHPSGTASVAIGPDGRKRGAVEHRGTGGAVASVGEPLADAVALHVVLDDVVAALRVAARERGAVVVTGAPTCARLAEHVADLGRPCLIWPGAGAHPLADSITAAGGLCAVARVRV